MSEMRAVEVEPGQEASTHPADDWTPEIGRRKGEELALRIERMLWQRRKARYQRRGRDWQERAARDALDAPW